jgi:hypothetical protein
VSQDSVDDILVFSAGNDPDCATATATGLYVDIEYSLETLRPGHRGMTLGG